MRLRLRLHSGSRARTSVAAQARLVAQLILRIHADFKIKPSSTITSQRNRLCPELSMPPEGGMLHPASTKAVAL
eukprot:3041208-Alexandrium_andersonii.AAC.1